LLSVSTVFHGMNVCVSKSLLHDKSFFRDMLFDSNSSCVPLFQGAPLWIIPSI